MLIISKMKLGFSFSIKNEYVYFIISYNHPAEDETKLKRLLFADGHEVADVDNTKN